MGHAHGEMAEWSKARDSKSRRPQKGLEGSNPSLSAMNQASGLLQKDGRFYNSL